MFPTWPALLIKSTRFRFQQSNQFKEQKKEPHGQLGMDGRLVTIYCVNALLVIVVFSNII